MNNSMKSFTVAVSAAGLLALGACTAPMNTSPAPAPKPAPAAVSPAPVAPAPNSSTDTERTSPDTNSNSDSTSSETSEESTVPSRTGYQNGLPGYMQCGIACGDEPSSADIQSGRASISEGSGPSSDSSGGAGSESIRQYQQWYGPGGPGSEGQLPGEITSECDATCAGGN